MANEFYNRGATFNPDELADGDALEAEFDAVVRGFDTINTAIDTDRAGYPTQTFHVAPATEATHAPQKAQLDAHIDDQGGVHGATSTPVPSKLMSRDSNGDVAARVFVGSLSGKATTATKVSASAPDAGATVLIEGSMAGSDAFRVLIAGSADGGFVEIATADNGIEPIVVRQYSDNFQTIAHEFYLLDGSGNTRASSLYIGGDKWLEYGSNSNGLYFRFADGTQICTRSVEATYQNPTSHAYAASFNSAPVVSATNEHYAAAYTSVANVTAISFTFISSTTANSVKITAIGRWK